MATPTSCARPSTARRATSRSLRRSFPFPQAHDTHGSAQVRRLRHAARRPPSPPQQPAGSTSSSQRCCVVAGSPDTWHRRLQVGLLALGGRRWVSHEAAARLHGLDRSPRRCRRVRRAEIASRHRLLRNHSHDRVGGRSMSSRSTDSVARRRRGRSSTWPRQARRNGEWRQRTRCRPPRAVGTACA